MPTYAYRCTSCGHDFETVQTIADAALTSCPECGGALRKVFHPVGVAFKGSGFYRTDSRPSSEQGAKSEDSSSDKKPAEASAKESPGEKPSSQKSSGGTESSSGRSRSSESSGSSKPSTSGTSDTSSKPASSPSNS